MPKVKPSLGPQPRVGKPSQPVTRCRVATTCHGEATGEQLRLRRVRLPGGTIAPTLCCEGCADHANQQAAA